MKILHIFDHSLPLHSGYSFRSAAILREQRKRGWETFHLTSPRHAIAGPNPEAVEEDLIFYRTAAAPGIGRRLPVIRELREIHAIAGRLDELIATLSPDLLHAHSPVLTALAALYAGRRHGLPVVYEIRATWEDAAVANNSTLEGSPKYRATRYLETFVARRVDAVICICEGLRTEFIRRGVSKDRLAVVANAVDTSQFHDHRPRDQELAKTLGLDDAEVVGFLGSFYDYEGLTTLLEAVAQVRTVRPRLRALLVGGGPGEAALKSLRSRLGLDSHVIMVGRVPQATIDRYYSLVDILAYPRLPTRVTELVTPLKPLEAMAQRKLVIASDVGGHKELIRHGETGVLFPAGNTAALARALHELFANRERWPQLTDAALRFVKTERTWDKSVANYQAVYERLLTRATP